MPCTVALRLLPDEQDAWLTAALAFIPARARRMAARTAGRPVAAVTSFVTHLFVHGDITHLLVNSAWLLAFGSPVARRTGAVRFLAVLLAVPASPARCSISAVNGGELTLLVGASGAISGLMGAAFRFLFGLTNADLAACRQSASTAPPDAWPSTLRDRRILTPSPAGPVLNMLLAWGAAGLTEAAGIAWEAHLGGFFAGLADLWLLRPRRQLRSP